MKNKKYKFTYTKKRKKVMKPARQRTKLGDSDWTSLFPVKQYTIGTTSLDISPLSIQELSGVLDKLSNISNKIQSDLINNELDEGVAKSSVTVINLVKIIMSESPDILSDISGLDVEDVQSLPLDKALELFNFCLDVNIESQEGLLKNFDGLTSRISKFTSPKTMTPATP
jgi:hypothetical protein